uniref:RING-type domain-containing protein n=1 Tax=Neolamprologus brichardi TaxID=32507 RepID=A0A3Q4ICC1_NEOBR
QKGGYRFMISDEVFGLGCEVCMSEPQEPVGLPCYHIYCLTCIKQSLDAGQTSCPKCRGKFLKMGGDHVGHLEVGHLGYNFCFFNRKRAM